MSSADWAAWFDRARAEGAGGDLALLADEAPGTDEAVAARVAAFHALRAAGAFRLAKVQQERLRQIAPEAAEALQASIGREQEPDPRVAHALVLAGHMVDVQDRTAPRFPDSMVGGVTTRIRESLERLSIGPGDHAFTSAAAGGDILLAEAAREAGMALTVCLPFSEAQFLESSVEFAGKAWVDRYLRLTRATGVALREMPPPARADLNPYERANRWMVYLALAVGARSVRGLVVWDRNEGDGPGGAAHMHALLRQNGIPVDVISPGVR